MGKIGDVEIKRIPPGQQVECQNGCSGIATSYRNGIPYCVDCLLAEQEKAWENEVNFIDSEGTVVRMEVVRHLRTEGK